MTLSIDFAAPIDQTLRSRLGALVYADSIDSTNQYLLTHSQRLPHKTACLAGEQTQGRGRAGKAWQSQSGDGLYCSLLWHHQGRLDALPPLSIVSALALSQAAGGFLRGRAYGIKWPNDLLTPHGKLAGILVESKILHSNHSVWVIGMGLNLDNQHQHDARYPRTDLVREGVAEGEGVYWRVAEQWLSSLLDWLEDMPDQRALPELWREQDIWPSMPVTLVDHTNQRWPVRLEGIAQSGALSCTDLATGASYTLLDNRWRIDWQEAMIRARWCYGT